jgi:exopolysaccharide biosynthesis protein
MPLQKAKLSIEPTANNPVCTTSAAVRENTIAAVNGGYFNIHGGLSASNVTVNGQLLCDPKDNTGLVNNVKLKPFLDAIYNRSELRVLVNSKGQTTVRIQNHNEPLPSGYILKHALQAGPRLLPTITAKEEAFLRFDSRGVQTDSIGVLKTAARTAVGITGDDRLIILCIAGPKQDEFSSGMTLAQLADLLRTLGCVEAMNFDGGTSTTMVIKNNNEPQCTMVCGREPQTIVKSCLLIKAEP